MTYGKIKISREERLKSFIKEELQRYYMYIARRDELETELDNFDIKYREIVNDPPIGGSIIKMPDGSPNNDNIVMRLLRKRVDIESNLLYYKNRVDTIEKWLDILTYKQKKFALVYICEYQCKNIKEAALEIKYAEDTVKHGTDPIINKIYKSFTKFM